MKKDKPKFETWPSTATIKSVGPKGYYGYILNYEMDCECKGQGGIMVATSKPEKNIGKVIPSDCINKNCRGKKNDKTKSFK